MNQKRVHTPEGVRDIYGLECKKRLRLKDKLNHVFALYGYENIITQLLNFSISLTVRKEPFPPRRCTNSLTGREIPWSLGRTSRLLWRGAWQSIMTVRNGTCGLPIPEMSF